MSEPERIHERTMLAMRIMGQSAELLDLVEQAIPYFEGEKSEDADIWLLRAQHVIRQIRRDL